MTTNELPIDWFDDGRRREIVVTPDERWVIAYSAGESSAHFEIHDFVGRSYDGKPEMSRGVHNNDGVTTDIREARSPVASGFRKRDGCLQFDIDTHTCGREMLVSLLNSVLAAYDLVSVDGWER